MSYSATHLQDDFAEPGVQRCMRAEMHARLVFLPVSLYQTFFERRVAWAVRLLV